MQINRILCPIDFSEFNTTANDYASAFAESSGAEIVYLHVSFPDVTYGSYAYVDMERDEAQIRNRLQEFKPTAEGIKASYVVEFGLPTDRIVEYAKENNVDLIVMGTHGHSGVRRAIMGSVAEAVVRKADCPVLAIKTSSKIPQPEPR